MSRAILSPVSGYPTVSATISCIYCKAILSFNGLPAVRYADHLSSEHRILFEQDEIITATIRKQLRGLLPDATDSRSSSSCSCQRSLPSVKIERKPKMMLRYKGGSKERTYTVATQTVKSSKDVMCQTLSEIPDKMLMLDVAIQTVEREELRSAPKVKIKLEDSGHVEPDNNPLTIQELLEAAMVNIVDNKYPCQVCDATFPSLFNVKTHILEEHFNKGEQVKTAKVPIKSVKKKCFRKLKKRKLTFQKKPWCNYCWIKFKNIKEYQLHRKACHPNLILKKKTSFSSESTVTGNSRKRTIFVVNKDEEGDEILDVKRSKSEDCDDGKISPMKYNKSNSVLNKREKRKQIRLFREDAPKTYEKSCMSVDEKVFEESSRSSFEDMKVIPIKAIKLVKNKFSDGYSTVDEDESIEDGDLGIPKEKESISEIPPSSGENQSETMTVISPKKATNKELISRSSIPIKHLKVILTEKVDEAKYIDYRGVYHVTELDKIGVSIEHFHQEMDNLITQPAASASRNNSIESNNDDTSDSIQSSNVNPKKGEEQDNAISNESISADINKINDEKNISEVNVNGESLKSVCAEDATNMCQLCKQKTDVIFHHITIFHKLKMSDYLVLFPSEKKKLLWFCGLCSKYVLKENKEMHLKVHSKKIKEEKHELVKEKNLAITKKNVAEMSKVSEESGKTKSIIGSKYIPASSAPSESQKPWFENKRVTCLHCHLEFWYGQFTKHVRLDHGQSVNLYQIHFPSADLSMGLYTCLVCGAGVPHYSAAISGHLSSKHGLSMQEYQSHFNFKTYQEEQDPLSLPSTSTSSNIQNPKPTSSSSFMFKTQEILQTSKSLVKPEDNVTSSAPKPVVILPKSANNMIAPWYNKCKWTCLICYKTFSSGFWRHVNEQHFMKKEEYLSDYGKQGITIVNYSCKICKMKVQWTGVHISNHVRTLHATTLDEYEEIYKEQTIYNEIQNHNKASTGTKQPLSVNVEKIHLEIKDQGSEKLAKPESSGGAWYDKCEWQCQICFQFVYSKQDIDWHTLHLHNISQSNYSMTYGERGMSRIFYNCRICEKRMLLSLQNVALHLERYHENVTILQYSKEFHQHVLNENELISTNVTPSKYEQEVPTRANLSSYTKEVPRLNQISFKVSSSTKEKEIPSAKQVNSVLSPYSMEVVTRPKQISSKVSSSTKEVKHKQISSDKWYNKCSYRCQICNEQMKTNHINFFKHVLEQHQIGREEYKEQYGTDGILFVDHTCKFCFKNVPCNGLNLSNHLKGAHNMSIDDYETILKLETDGKLDLNLSDPYQPQHSESVHQRSSWYNKCSYKCNICGRVAQNLGTSKQHIHAKHAISYEEYHAIYGDQGITQVNFTCSICSRVIACNCKTITQHLKKSHQLTLMEYEKLYIKLDEKESSTGDKASPQIKTEVDEKEQGDKEDGQGSNNIIESQTQWYNQCRYTCQICAAVFFRAGRLTLHYKTVHMMTKVEYINHFGDKGMKDVFYNCKICQKTVLCQQVCIVNHLENCHQVSLTEYSDMYEERENSLTEKQIVPSEPDPLDCIETENPGDSIEHGDEEQQGHGNQICNLEMLDENKVMEKVEEEEEEEMSIIPEDDDYFKMSIEEEDDILVANLSANKDEEITVDTNISVDEKEDETNNYLSVVSTDPDNIKGNLSTDDIRNILESDSDG